MSDEPSERVYVVIVSAWGLDDAAIDALFERVVEAAHALDEEVIVSGGYENGLDA